MSAWESESHSGLIGATAAPSELSTTKLQWKQCEAHSNGSAVYSVTQRWSGRLDPSSPACMFSVNSLHELHGTLSLSLARAGERGKSWPVILFIKKLY